MPASLSNITISLATASDGPALASLMTASFSASDAAYPLVWDSAPEGTHDAVALEGLFTPVQKEGRVTWKVTARTGLNGNGSEEDDKDGDRKEDAKEIIVGAALWTMPREVEDGQQRGVGGGGQAGEGEGGLPDIPGVNMSLWRETFYGRTRKPSEKVDKSKDIYLSVFFTHPSYQRRGIGSLLLEWGIRTADAQQKKIWLVSTPQAARLYEKFGWEVVDEWVVDLEAHGGEGTYVKRRMVRAPREGMGGRRVSE